MNLYTSLMPGSAGFQDKLEQTPDYSSQHPRRQKSSARAH
jgi:hypothetical protein